MRSLMSPEMDTVVTSSSGGSAPAPCSGAAGGASSGSEPALARVGADASSAALSAGPAADSTAEQSPAQNC